MIACHYSGLKLGAVKHNQGPTNSKRYPPTSVQIISDQPKQLASTKPLTQKYQIRQ